MDKKADLTLNYIVIIAILLIAMMIIILIFYKQSKAGEGEFDKIRKGITSRYCETPLIGGTCSKSDNSGNSNCQKATATTYVDCSEKQMNYCCIPNNNNKNN